VNAITFTVPGAPVGKAGRPMIVPVGDRKACSACKAEKPLSEFGKDKSLASGFMAACRVCMSARASRYQASDPGRGARFQKKSREKNREKIAAREKKYRDAHREKYILLRAEYRIANPEKIKALQDRWRNSNKEKIAAYDKQRAKLNPEAIAAKTRNRAARKKLAGGRHTAQDVRRLFELQHGYCAACRKSIVDGYHVDHVRALSKGGSNGPENLQLLCPTCNLKKGAKENLAFMREKGYLL
jgi:5-methylcytosine-specific restriction endonuclease McrA